MKFRVFCFNWLLIWFFPKLRTLKWKLRTLIVFETLNWEKNLNLFWESTFQPNNPAMGSSSLSQSWSLFWCSQWWVLTKARWFFFAFSAMVVVLVMVFLQVWKGTLFLLFIRKGALYIHGGMVLLNALAIIMQHS